jgi:hypothetical protein
MPSPPQNIRILQRATCSGTVTRPSTGGQSPVEWTKDVVRLTDVRPASKSNPVRKDGTRAQSSWRHSAFYQHLGSGLFTYQNSGSADRYDLRGQVTVGRSVIVTPNHTEALALLNDARMKALSGLSSSKSQFNVAAAEARGTVRSLSQFCQKAAHGVKRLYKSIPETLRGKYNGSPPYQWRDAPGDYLGYLYGLKPIADDIGNGLDQLSGLSKRGMSFGYSVKSGSSRSSSIEDEVVPPGMVYPFKVPCTRKAFARVGYTYNFPQWWIDSAPIVTPFSDAWELTRMSFVLDWVLPVGNWIGAMEAAQFDPYFKSGFEVYGTDEVTQPGPFTWAGQDYPGRIAIMQNSSFGQRRYEMVRQGLGSEDNPSTRTRFPSFRNYLGLDQAAQSLALLTQVMKTPPSRW